MDGLLLTTMIGLSGRSSASSTLVTRCHARGVSSQQPRAGKTAQWTKDESTITLRKVSPSKTRGIPPDAGNRTSGSLGRDMEIDPFRMRTGQTQRSTPLSLSPIKHIVLRRTLPPSNNIPGPHNGSFGQPAYPLPTRNLDNHTRKKQ